MAIYTYYDIKTGWVEIKFVDTLKATSITDSVFKLYNNSSATPSLVVNGFQPIVLIRDYSSVSRTVTLYWGQDLLPNTDYSIVIAGLKTVTGLTIATETIEFTTGTSDLPIIEEEDIPTRVPVEVEDYSIKDISAFLPNIVLSAPTTSFKLSSVKPSPEDSAYLDPSFNEGRIELTFNVAPAANFISTDYFKVQRKAIQKGIARWEDVAVLVTSSPLDKYVFIYMPSVPQEDGDIVEYAEPDLVYWEEGYKYRLRISSEIGPSAITT